ncbi:hypothetical protein V5799_005386 [Amblyomma americanum]|uniref:Secreted protein n=1 Tax=Amblyomma americanum TaxID=6943 RepID=A0AAQ4DZE3_AMBAM
MGLLPSWTLLVLLLVAHGAVAQTTPEEPATAPTTEEPPTTTPDAAEAVRRSWAKVESMLKSTVDTQLRRLLPQMLRASGEAGMSPECQAANFKVMLGLRQLKSWAIRLPYTSLIIQCICGDDQYRPLTTQQKTSRSGK